MKSNNFFKYLQNPFTIIKNLINYVLFKIVTKKSSNLFLRGTDKLSIIPQTEGLHEPLISSYIKFSAEKRMMSDFLIDIGANIGLISCQSGSSFKRVICFEPNPLCVNILRVNTAISLGKNNIVIYDYGLGTKDENHELWIPKKNWGGAFIRSKDNLYKDKILASKDGFQNLDESNYIIENVKVCCGASKLSILFKDLLKNNLLNGVVKIDVEGMEHVILKSISESLPDNINLDIIFENWDDKLNFDIIKNYFKNRKIVINKLENKIPYKKTWPKIIKGIAMILSANITTLKKVDNNKSSDGDIIININ